MSNRVSIGIGGREERSTVSARKPRRSVDCSVGGGCGCGVERQRT